MSLIDTASFVVQDGKTALHLAVERGHTIIVAKLLDSSADLGKKVKSVNILCITKINANWYIWV